MQITAAGLSDPGRVRGNNEDSFLVSEPLGLFVVADGMGGHLAGEVAGKVAVDTLREFFESRQGKPITEDALFGGMDESLSLAANLPLSGIRLANRVVSEMAEGKPEFRGMGATVALIKAGESTLTTANVGESRIYLLREGYVEQLSRDHTLAQDMIDRGLMTKDQAAQWERRHLLTQALGHTDEVHPEVCEFAPGENDRYLLCSDGLTDMLTDEEILDVAAPPRPLGEACEALVSAANEKGGRDNITVVAIDVTRVRRGLKGLQWLLVPIAAVFLAMVRWLRRYI